MLFPSFAMLQYPMIAIGLANLWPSAELLPKKIEGQMFLTHDRNSWMA